MKKRMQKILAMLLAAGMTFSLAACTSSTDPDDGNSSAPESSAVDNSETPGGASSETLTVAINAEPDALYPQYAYSSSVGVVSTLMYDTLVSWDAENNCAGPNLATDWEWVDDTHFRLNLRDDVYFSDGDQLTAEDVVFSFQVTDYTGSGSSSYSRIFDLDNCVAEGDFTVVLALNSPYPIVADILAADVYSIISKDAVEAAGGEDAAARAPVNLGTGKYVFSEWVEGQYIKLVRNEDYWNQDELPYYQEVMLTFISDNTSRAMAVQSGDADVALNLGTTQVEGLEADSNVTVSVENTSTNRTMYMNCSDPALSDVNVRTALWYLIDAEAIRAIANSGFGELSETSFSQFCAVYAAPPADFTRTVDVEAAVELLNTAGYNESNPLQLSLLMPSEGDNETMAQLVQAQLEASGCIKVEIELLEIMTFLNQLWSGDYQLTITSGDQYDYEKLLYMVDGRIDPATASGGAQYDDAEFQVLLDECYTETDENARRELYAEIQAYLLENHIVIGICNQVAVTAYSADITGITINVAGVPDVTGMHPTG